MIVASTRITTNKNNKSKRTRTATTTANTGGWWVLIPKKVQPNRHFPPQKYQPPKHHHPLTNGHLPVQLPRFATPKNGLPTDINTRPVAPPRWTTRAMASWFVASTNVTIRRSSMRPGVEWVATQFFQKNFLGWNSWYTYHDKHVYCIYIYMLYHYYYYISSLRWIHFYSNWDDISQIECLPSFEKYRKHFGHIWKILEKGYWLYYPPGN